MWSESSSVKIILNLVKISATNPEASIEFFLNDYFYLALHVQMMNDCNNTAAHVQNFYN